MPGSSLLIVKEHTISTSKSEANFTKKCYVRRTSIVSRVRALQKRNKSHMVVIFASTKSAVAETGEERAASDVQTGSSEGVQVHGLSTVAAVTP